MLKNSISKAKHFCNTFRYIDDLLTINNPSFENEINNIYPSELILKKTTESGDTVSYLDIGISVQKIVFSVRRCMTKGTVSTFPL